ncbi:putative 4-hydroxy-4-methyl-2-oxoglutarate aldolase 2 [Capsicum annuum]|uniref:4-hydroxy-4-methyl-2-oxoglutarate aldolase 2 n=1 Tax=Capsicum annuum TaxID=4072 RepID=A0A2G2YRW9_CAPAN|nr:putative 4-hydroxy-4-methyl-2-oxoglutarate aldolase 2 [Capsicum annuum]
MALVTITEVAMQPQLIMIGKLHAPQPIFKIYGRVQVFSGPVVTHKVFEDNVWICKFLEKKGNGRAFLVDGGGSLRCSNLGDDPVVLERRKFPKALLGLESVMASGFM